MAYLKPGFFPKLFNRIALRFGLSDSQALVVKGRNTGEPMRIPVIPVEHGDGRYIVSTRGESEWVRNMRAPGGGEIGGRAFTAVEVPAEEREPIIAAYREKAARPWTPTGSGCRTPRTIRCSASPRDFSPPRSPHRGRSTPAGGRPFRS